MILYWSNNLHHGFHSRACKTFGRLVLHKWYVRLFCSIALANLFLGLDSDQLDFGPDEEEDPRQHAEPTIPEDSIEEAEEESKSYLNSPRFSYKRFSNHSDDKRLSITSLRISEKGAASNRSSATIRAVPGNVSLDDVDFENALRKFAAERESFLLDLSTTAGVVQNQRKPRPRTQRIISDDGQGLKSGPGSTRRRISFREMSSVKRQPSVIRQGDGES